MERLIKVLKEREDISVIEYFFIAVLIVIGVAVAFFEYLL